MATNDANKQTAFTSVGIPTGEAGAAPTDGLSDVVDAITDRIEKDATGEVDAERAKAKRTTESTP